MGANFRSTDRSQPMLLPPCVEDYVPEEQLARLVIETVDQLDLACLVGSYNADGMGGAAIAPKAILEPLIYAYAHALTSSRDSETLCRENTCQEPHQDAIQPCKRIPTSYIGETSRYGAGSETRRATGS